MDISKIKALKTDLITIVLATEENEDGDALESGFKALGSNSDEYQVIDRAWNKANLKKAAKRGRGIDASTDTGAEELTKSLKKRDLAMVNACVKEIFGFTDAKGEPLPVEPETFEAIFADAPEWLTKTLFEIRLERDFTKPSSAA